MDKLTEQDLKRLLYLKNVIASYVRECADLESQIRKEFPQGLTKLDFDDPIVVEVAGYRVRVRFEKE